MSGATGTVQATNTLPPLEHPPAKAISKILTADWFWALCILVGAVFIPAPQPADSTVLGLPKLCIFRNITGIACPGCGMTRSLIATGHFHLTDAITFHPLGPIVYVVLATYCVSVFVGWIKGRHGKPSTKVIRNSIPIFLAIGFAFVWIARLLGLLTTPK